MTLEVGSGSSLPRALFLDLVMVVIIVVMVALVIVLVLTPLSQDAVVAAAVPRRPLNHLFGGRLGRGHSGYG